MPHTFTNILVHVVFSAKDRAPMLDAELKPRVLGYIGGIVRELGGTSLAANGPADHVHLFVALPATPSLADCVRTVKTNSSRWVHEQWPERKAFGWQTGYAAFSVSQSNVEDVKAYIARQEEHHKRVSFQEEFLAFLRRHGLEYDERYVWD
jgi:REP element-mobilizing transposase RayT